MSAMDASLSDLTLQKGKLRLGEGEGMCRVHSLVERGLESSSPSSGELVASRPSRSSLLASHRHREPFTLNKAQAFKFGLQLGF